MTAINVTSVCFDVKMQAVPMVAYNGEELSATCWEHKWFAHNLLTADTYPGGCDHLYMIVSVSPASSTLTNSRAAVGSCSESVWAGGWGNKSTMDKIGFLSLAFDQLLLQGAGHLLSSLGRCALFSFAASNQGVETMAALHLVRSFMSFSWTFPCLLKSLSLSAFIDNSCSKILPRWSRVSPGPKQNPYAWSQSAKVSPSSAALASTLHFF